MCWSRQTSDPILKTTVFPSLIYVLAREKIQGEIHVLFFSFYMCSDQKLRWNFCAVIGTTQSIFPFWSQWLVERWLFSMAYNYPLKQQATQVIFKACCYFWLLQKFFTRGFSNWTGRFELIWRILVRVFWTPTFCSPHTVWRISMTREGWFPFTSCRSDKPALVARNKKKLLLPG